MVGLQPALALPVDVVHLLTMGLWLGGLVTLVVILRPAGTTNTDPYSGTWQLTVTVRTSEIDETTVAIPIDIS